MPVTGRRRRRPAVIVARSLTGVDDRNHDSTPRRPWRTIVMLNAQDNAVPPLVATDGEGGIVDLSLEIADPLPPAREMASWDDARIQEAGASRGEDLLDRGVNVDFAPVVDVAGGA